MADLITLSRLKQLPSMAALGTSHDTFLASLISSVSDGIERWLGRSLTSAERTEKYDGDGCPELLLDAFPVTAVSSVLFLDTDGDTSEAFTASSFLIDEDLGAIRFKGSATASYFPRGRQNIQATYTGGFATIPSEIQQAVCDAVAWAFHVSQRQDHTLTGEKLGDWSADYADPNVLADLLASGRFPSSLYHVLVTYKVRRL